MDVFAFICISDSLCDNPSMLSMSKHANNTKAEPNLGIQSSSCVKKVNTWNRYTRYHSQNALQNEDYIRYSLDATTFILRLISWKHDNNITVSKTEIVFIKQNRKIRHKTLDF